MQRYIFSIKSMVYECITLNGFGRKIGLKFYSSVTLLGGDSGIGKSLLYQMLSKISIRDKFNNIYCINSESLRQYNINLLRALKSKKNKLIVIYNAEEILGKKEREFILTNHFNQYLIIGRNRDGLGIGHNGIGELVVDNDKMYIKYRLKEESDELSNRQLNFKIRLP